MERSKQRLAWLKITVMRHPLLLCIVAAIGFISVVVGAGMYADSQVWDFSTNNGLAQGIGLRHSITDTFVRYDAGHYIHIAQHGYQFLNDLAFLPLYINLIRLVAGVGFSFSWAALIVSWLALCAAVVALYYYAAVELSIRNMKFSPWIVLGILAIFPTSFYFALPYTESIFLLLNICALLSYRKKLYLPALIFAGLAAATRYQGIILSVYFIADYYFDRKSRSLKKLLPVAGSIVGLGMYMVFLAIHFHTPFAFIDAEKQWGRLTGNPVIDLVKSLRPIMVWFLGIAVFGLYCIKKYLGTPYLLYSIAFMALPLLSGRFDSFNRYLVCLVPFTLAISMWYADEKTPNIVKQLYVVSSAILLAWSLMLFANGYWVG